MRSKRQHERKCMCVWNDFANSLLVCKKKKKPSSLSALQRDIISCNDTTTKAISCNCENENPRKYSFMQMSIALWFHITAANAWFLNLWRGAHRLHWRHSETYWWIWFHTPQQEAQTPSVHCNVLAEVESHLSVIMEPCRHRWLLTLTNNLHSFSNRTGIMFRSEWAGNYWRRTAQKGEMGMAETWKKKKKRCWKQQQKKHGSPSIWQKSLLTSTV